MKQKSAIAINQTLNKDFTYILLHPMGSGFSFTYFWNGGNGPLEPVAVGPKVFKTKAGCVTGIKKFAERYSCMSVPACYDQDGKRIDIEIKYDVRKLL